MISKYIVAAALFVAVHPAAAQVRQAGNVTPGHAAMWTTTGVIQDGGTPAKGNLTGVGVTASGPGICQNSGPVTGAYNQFCLGVTQNGGANISLYNYAGATGGFTFTLNGVTQGMGTVNLPTTTNDVACFADATGTLKDCGNLHVSGSALTLTGGPLNITPNASSLGTALVISQSLPTTGSSGAAFFGNSITIGQDAVNFTAANPIGFIVNYTWGGANAKKGRIAVVGQSNLAVASVLAATDGPLGGAFIGTASVNAGGTDTGAGALGSVAGANVIGQLNSGATNFSSLTGLEVDAEVFSGATVKNRWGVASVSIGTGSGGASNDAAFPMWAASGAPGWGNALFLSNLAGGAPLATTGCIVCTDGTAWTIGKGVDLTNLTITGNAWRSNGVILNGVGKLALGGAAITDYLTILTGTDDGIRITDGTVGGHIWSSGLSTHSMAIGTTTNHPVNFIANNTLWADLGVTGSWTWPAYGAGALSSSAGGIISFGTLPTPLGGTGVTTGAFLKTKITKFIATATYTPTTGALYTQFECVGGGGGGGGVTGLNTAGRAGGGGGGGGYSRVAVPSTTQTITIGGGGVGASAGSNVGSAGGDTSVGSICIGKGGSGGNFNDGASGFGEPGAGGVAGTGDFTPQGIPGLSGGTTTITTVVVWSGAGGNSPFGGGAKAQLAASGSNNNGNAAASNTGAGGSGGAVTGVTGNSSGGNGGSGYAIVTEFLNQ